MMKNCLQTLPGVERPRSPTLRVSITSVTNSVCVVVEVSMTTYRSVKSALPAKELSSSSLFGPPNSCHFIMTGTGLFFRSPALKFMVSRAHNMILAHLTHFALSLLLPPQAAEHKWPRTPNRHCSNVWLALADNFFFFFAVFDDFGLSLLLAPLEAQQKWPRVPNRHLNMCG